MSQTETIALPDIGGFTDVPVIEVLVSEGQEVAVETPLLTLESDKATLEVPSPSAGRILRMRVKVGDTVSEGSPLCELEPAAGPRADMPAAAAPPDEAAATVETPAPPPAETPPAAAPPAGTPPAAPPPAETAPAAAPSAGMPATAPPPAGAPPISAATPASAPPDAEAPTRSPPVHASPSVRRFARELGVDPARVRGSGPKGRILRDDVQNYARNLVRGAQAGTGTGAAAPAPAPEVDFARWGPTETVTLSRIRQRSAQAVLRSWTQVPQVTQFDEADVTELEQFRRQTAAGGDAPPRLTLTAFALKASAAALREWPDFCASLSADGGSLIRKRYCHIGVAVDTERGLLVPVVRDVDKKGLFELARDLAALSDRARAGELSPADMQGGCFSVSSLGGIGGTGFTPIVNAPEVAILGLSRVSVRPVWQDDAFVPRQILPFSLSYDHRVIDGAAAARFTRTLSALFSDIRRLLL